MNNEPVAFVTGAKEFERVDVHTVLKVGTPLYTHPAELTDKEMYELLEKYQGIELCKAVLRKAQEK